jgi:hypothetical protein
MATQKVEDQVRLARTGDHTGLLGAGFIALGIGLAVNSLIGPFAFGIVDYPLSETLHNQTIGLDAASLLLVAPVSLAIGIMVQRGHPAVPYVGSAPTPLTCSCSTSSDRPTSATHGFCRCN